ncbi:MULTISPECIES: NAD(P)-dependent oxidoreductase [Sphingomonas]|uniref:NAD(P)-dependent oxidoreductase n=1 Tax=Sphingomonas TaxID=13687 RepID=UPI0007020960|nr:MULTISPECIES: NAD(P)-dependent oxidoreductase [Sphingomonas]KQM94728.1 oxidoreductase [Sphingomonas sp. Leaf226]MDY0968092.1 NAD(P)-dependent oxidoreductase [Sphingomonas sp. CFBP9021]USR01259.1 NAD(P)-dependent oxidoreductase [Sphingomonas aerolata]
MAKLAFIGTGVMGAPMAGHLVAAGHDVTVYNRSQAKALAWADKYGGSVADTPALAARDADAVFTCVGNDDDLAAVTLAEDGVFAAMRDDAVFVDHTTVSAAIARRLADARALVVDAPVSGGQAGAENGKLSIMCGGSADAMAKAEPYMQAYAARIVHVGDAGAGQTTKMCNQIAIAGVIQGVSESIRFAQNAGLDLDKVFEAISGGAAQSWQMVNRWPTMAKEEFDFGFAVDWMRKDLGLALVEARRNGAVLPVAALVDQFYADVQAMGGARQDTSALVRRLPK